MIKPSRLNECCGTTCNARANRAYVAKLEAKLHRYTLLLDDVYSHGKSNPMSAPNCAIAVVEAIDAEDEEAEHGTDDNS